MLPSLPLPVEACGFVMPRTGPMLPTTDCGGGGGCFISDLVNAALLDLPYV